MSFDAQISQVALNTYEQALKECLSECRSGMPTKYAGNKTDDVVDLNMLLTRGPSLLAYARTLCANTDGEPTDKTAPWTVSRATAVCAAVLHVFPELFSLAQTTHQAAVRILTKSYRTSLSSSSFQRYGSVIPSFGN